MTEKQTQPIGIIDALSTGYRLLVQHWPLISIPLLLDLFFWLGPQVSPWAAFQTLLDMADPELQKLFASALGMETLDFSQAPAGPNLLTALVQTPGAPGSLAAALGVLPPPPGWEPLQMAPTSPWGLIGLVVVLVILGAPIAGLYISLAARAVQGPAKDNGHFWRQWAWATVHLVLLVVLAILLFGAAVMGLSVMALVGGIVDLSIAASILALGTLFISWVGVILVLFLYFTPASIALYRANVLRAIAASARFVWHNLWSSVGLILLSMLISEGFALIWRRLFTSVWGALVSMAGNAFLTTGLTLGTFVFFLDRYQRMVAEAPQGGEEPPA